MSGAAKQERRRASPATYRYFQSIRVEASATAYRTALDWMQRLPAEEVLRRLRAKIEEKEQEYRSLQSKAAEEQPT